MSNSMLIQMVDLCTAHLIWDKLNVYYASHTRAKVRQLKLHLKSYKCDCSISSYILDIKRVIDSFAATDCPISYEDYIDAILDGLHEKYDIFITSITLSLFFWLDRFEKHKFHS